MPRKRVAAFWTQYTQLATQYPEAILLFQMGFHYEAYRGDAEIVARVLDRDPGTRQISLDNQVAMIVILRRELVGTIAELNAKGYIVAVADQVPGIMSQGTRARQIRSVSRGVSQLEP